jgi:acetolactate synthase-1/2/3 large subunit
LNNYLKLSEYANEGDIIITDAGQTLTWTMQTWKVKDGQRLFSAFNHSPMGYALPASIGAYFGNFMKNDSNIICITGDGGFQMNLQELNTIRGYDIPVKIFVLNNKGYGMIKQTQSDWDVLKDGVGTEPYMTDLQRIANAFGILYLKVLDERGYEYLNKALGINGPIIVEIMIPDKTKIQPKLKYGNELTDLTPKLSEKQKNEIIKKLK